MAHLLGTERERYVKKTFKSVARRYNMMNHLMTFGVDILLRKEVHAKRATPARAQVSPPLISAWR